MAKNKIQIEVEVNGKMQKATVSAKKLKKALDGAKTSQNELNTSTRQGYRAAQGAAQNTSNGTKAFAKQAGVVGGLVPIYATFAANVFAISAAFNALRRASALDKLETSLKIIGIEGGRNLTAVANDLKNITDQAISTEQALRATSVATTSGFSQTQLLGLTKVAKGASLALGRDMGDALDRLIRGTAKLEPEILDELGIIVRLDRASSDYAATLGKTAQQLTQFEKTQAFVNATITQGINKYDMISERVEASPYDKLAASFNNLSKAVITFSNTILGPVVDFLSSNSFALTGALAIFGSTLLNQVVPAIDEVVRRQKDIAISASNAAKKARIKVIGEYEKIQSRLQVMKFTPKVAGELIPKIKAGTNTVKELERAVLSLKRSEDSRNRRTKAGFDENAKTAEYRKETAAIREQRLELEKLKMAEKTRTVTTSAGEGLAAKSRIAKRTASYGSKIDSAGVLGGFAVAAKGVAKNSKEVARATTIFNGLGASIRVASSAVSLFGRALLNAIPIVGQLLFVFSLLKPAYDKIFGDSEVEKSVKDSIKRFNVFAESVELLGQKFEESGNVFTRVFDELKVSAGVFDEVGAAIRRASDAGSEVIRSQIDAQIKTIIDQRQKLEAAQAQLALIEQRQEAQRASAAGQGRLQYQEDQTRDIPSGDVSPVLELAQEQVESLKEAVDSTDKVLKELFERLNTVDTGTGVTLVEQAIGRLGKNALPLVERKLEKIREGIEKGNSEFTKTLSDGTVVVDSIKLSQALALLSSQSAGFEGNIKGGTEALSNFAKEANKIAAKQVTPYDGIIEQSEEATRSINAVFEQFAKSITEESIPTGKLVSGAEIASASIEDILKDSRAGDIFREAMAAPIDEVYEKFPALKGQVALLEEKLDGVSIVTRDDLIAAQGNYNEKLREANEILRDRLATEAKEQALLSRLNKLREAGSAIVPLIQSQEDRVLDTKIKALEASRDVVDLSLTEEQNKSRIAQIDAEIASLEATRKTEAEKAYEQVQALVAEKQRELDVSQRNIAALRESFNIQKRAAELARENVQRQGFEGSRVFGQDAAREAKKAELQDALKFQKENEARINAEADIKKQQILIEYTLLDAKYAYLQEELNTTKRKLELEAAALKRPTGDAAQDLANKARAEEIESRLPSLDTSIKGLQALRDQFGLLRDENGMATGGTEGGLLKRILGNVDGAATNEVNSLRNSIKQLVFEVSQFDTIEATFNAGANSLRDNLGGALSDVLEGTKSVKEGFADLATGILKSMQKVLMDRVAEDFVNFLAGKSEGTFMERFFKPTNTTGVDTSDSGPLGPVTQPSQLPQTGVQTAATSPMPGIGGAMATAGAQMGTPVSIVGGLGSSPGMPLYVAMVQDPLTSAIPQEGQPGAAGAVAGAAGAVGGAVEEDPQTAAIKENTEATSKLNVNTVSAVTAGLATVAALTGNEKAAAALALVTAGLQIAQMLQSTLTSTDTSVTGINTIATTANTTTLAANTAALAANTAATAASAGFRTGGISTPGGPMKGYSTGGISRGSQSGYPVTLHGTEAVVPLPNGKSIPVEVSGGGNSMNQNNVNVNVVMNSDGSAQSKTTEQEGRDAAELGRSISIAVQEELKKQKRSGGMLSPYGVA